MMGGLVWGEGVNDESWGFSVEVEGVSDES